MENKETITVSGKRKTSIAKATIKKGKGSILINKVPYENLQNFHFLSLNEPLEIAKRILNKEKLEFDISVNIHGGGIEGQIASGRLAIAKALLKFTGSDELKKAFMNYDKNMVVADVRRKEPYKPGDSKARSKRQSSKR